MRHLFACGAVLAGLAVVVPPAAETARQTPPPAQTPAPQQPTFRSRIDTVSVDVSVTDKQGQPVTDLKAEEFEIRESKQIQKIENFKLIEVDASTDAPTPVLSLAQQTIEITREDTRLIVIYLDDYHTRQINSLRLRRQLAVFVSQLSPRDLVTVVSPLMPVDRLTFSYNHDAIAEVVASFDGRKYDYRPRNGLEAEYSRFPAEQIELIRNDIVIRSLRDLCMYLGTIRQGRKSVLYVSEGMVSQMPPGVTTIGGMSAGMPLGTTQAAFAAGQLVTDLTKIFDAAGRANVSIYPIDPRGLSAQEFSAADRVSQDMDRQLFNEATDLLRTIAGETDGRAILNRNDPGPGLNQMLRTPDLYYLLGYTTSAPRDGRFHEIQVRVKRRDVEVRARKGFWAYTEEEVTRATAPAKPAPPRELTGAIEALSTLSEPASRRPVRVTMGAVRGEGEAMVVTLAWEASADTPPADPMDAVDHVSLTVTSLTGREVFKGTVARDPQATRASGAVTFSAPGGALGVRAVAENARGLRLDTAEMSFDLPRPPDSGLVILPPLIYRGRSARDLQQIRAAATPMPAATRTFSRAERLLLRFDVLGPTAAPPTAALKLLNQSGGPIADLPAPVPVAGVPGRFEAEIGLAPLPPSTYVIEINAETAGSKGRTLIAIRVVG